MSYNLILGKKKCPIISNIPHPLHPKPFVSTHNQRLDEDTNPCSDQWVPSDGQEKSACFLLFSFWFYKKQNKTGFFLLKQNAEWFRGPRVFSSSETSDEGQAWLSVNRVPERPCL